MAAQQQQLVATVLLALCTAMTSALHLDILAFGDSLTAGFCGNDFHGSHHPYTINLSKLLKGNADYIDANVVVRGLSGELVIPDDVLSTSQYGRNPLPPMTKRLPDLLNKVSTSGQKYDWVLIMGGINDIGSGAKGAVIFQGLRSLYEASKAHGAKVIAMTCMQSAFCSEMNGTTPYNQERLKLNVLIRQYVARAAGLGEIVLLDLENEIPWLPKEEGKANMWAPDGLHLLPDGYDKLGQLLYTTLLQAVKPTP